MIPNVNVSEFVLGLYGLFLPLLILGAGFRFFRDIAS